MRSSTQIKFCYIKQWLFFIVIACHPLISFASFTLSGTTITQSGTDNNLSGLSAITGVTVLTTSGGVGHTYTIYNLNALNLEITGSLTIDPQIESLLVGATTGRPYIDVLNGGTLVIGRQITVNGFTDYSQGLAIYVSDDTHRCCDEGASFMAVRDGGRFDWYGGEISVSGPELTFRENSDIRIYSQNAVLRWRESHRRNQIRQRSNNLISDGFTMIGGGSITFIDVPTRFDNYNPIQVDGAIGFSANTPNIDIIFRGYSGSAQGNTKDINLWRGSRPIIINSKNGSNLNVGAFPNPTISNAYGVVLVVQEFNLLIKDINGNPVEGVRYFIRDTDHGNRETYNQESHTVDNTADNVYSDITNTNGELNTPAQILLAANVVNTGNSDAPNTGNYAWDYRGKENNDTDKFDIFFWGYNYLSAQSEQILKGNEQKVIEWTLFEDGNISETDQNVVAGYATIDNLDQLYDYSKYWKVSSTINVEYPAINTNLINTDGATLDLGAMNLNIDPTASTVFDVNMASPGTITLKSIAALGVGQRFHSITTTGNVSALNGATIEFGYEHNDGTSQKRVKYIEARGLISSNVKIIDRIPTTEVELANSGILSGTYKVNFDEPTDATDTQIEVSRSGYNTYLDRTNADALTIIYQPLLRKDDDKRQRLIINYLMMLLQKTEAIRNAYNMNNPTLNITTTPTTTTGEATLANQEKMIDLILKILVRTSASREAIKG